MPSQNGVKPASRFSSLNVLKLKAGSGFDAVPPPPPKDSGYSSSPNPSLNPSSAFYHRAFFSRSATSLAPSLSPDSVSGPVTPPSPYPPMPGLGPEFGKRSHNTHGRAAASSPVPSASGGSLKSLNRGGRDYFPSPSVDGSTDSSGSCPNVGSNLALYLSNGASSSSYTLGQETTSSVKVKKSVFKLANLAKRNRSKKDLSDTGSASGSASRTTSVSESDGVPDKAVGDDGISMPWNFQHHIHVDEGYIGLPPSWSAALSKVGFSEDEIAMIHARRRVAANLANPRTSYATHGPSSPHPIAAVPANMSSTSSSTTLIEPAPRSTSLGKRRDALTISPPSMLSASGSTNGEPTSPRTPSFLVKSFVTGIKNSLSSDCDSPTTTEDVGGLEGTGGATSEETEQYVFVDADGPDEGGSRGMGNGTLIEPYSYDSSSTSTHASRTRQMPQDQHTPQTPTFSQIQLHRTQPEVGHASSPSPAPRAPSPLSHSTSLPIPTPPHGYTYSNNSTSRTGPLSAPPRTPFRRIYHVANASSDGEDYSEPPPAYDSPKKGEWTPRKEKEISALPGGPPPPNRPIHSVPVEQTHGAPSSMSNHDSAEKYQEASLTETSEYTMGSINIPRTADEVLDISSYYSDNSVHGGDAEMGPAQLTSVLSPTPPLMIDKSLTKLATLPPRLSFHQEGSLEDWSESLFHVIGGKGKRSSVLIGRRNGEAGAKERRVRPMAPLSESGNASMITSNSLSSEIVVPSLPDISSGTNLTLGSIARPTVDAIDEESDKQEQAEEDEVEATQDTCEQDTGKQVVDSDTTTAMEKEVEEMDGSLVVSSTPPLPDISPGLKNSALGEDLEPPVATSSSPPASPRRVDVGGLPPTPPPKPKLSPLAPPASIALVLPRTNVITGVSGRSPVNSLFGVKPQPLPIPISPSQIRAQLRPAPPKSPHPPPTLPLPPLRRIASQPNTQPPPQSQLPPIPSPQKVLKHDFITSQASSSDPRHNSSQTLQPTRLIQGDRDSGMSMMTVTPATIATAKSEVVRTAVASVIDSDIVSLASRRESNVSTADTEPQTVADDEPDMGGESPRTLEQGEAPGDSMVSETSSVSLLHDSRSKWPAPPPPPVELEADSTPRRLSRFRTTSLGRVSQLQAMNSTATTPVVAHFSLGSADTGSSSTSESTPLTTPNGVNGTLPVAKGGLAAEAKLLGSRIQTGGIDIETEGEDTESHSHPLGIPLSDLNASPATHPLLAQLQPFITPRNPASCFTNLVEIAEGESGSVFAARVAPSFAEPLLRAQEASIERHIPPGTSHVAIKRIALPPASSLLSLSDDSPVSNKLVSVLHEVSLLKNLDHEHLLLLDAVYVGPGSTPAEDTESANAVDTSLWIRMELMERSLADVIGLVAEGLRLQERLIGRFASDILNGLDYLQRQHIAHRDVRSDNLLVNATGIVKLADFSNAIRVDRNAPMVKGVVGVIYWQAPEMRAGPYNALKVDIWSLGATVWELAESIPPFSMPASPSEQVPFAIQTARHVGSQWPPLSHPEHYSRAFHEFLRLCGRESAARPCPGELLNTQFIRNICGRGVILQLLSQCRAIEEAMMAEEKPTRS